MQEYSFDEVLEKRKTGSAKWDGLEQLFGSDQLIPMWVADMDVRPADSITKALTKRAASGHFGYSLFEEDAKRAILHWFKKRYDQPVDEETILYSSGVVPALAHSVLALTEKEDEIIIQTPVYPPFHHVIASNERQLIENPLLLTKGRYEIDFSLLEQQMKTARMIILCNPHNPTGRVFSQSEIQRLVSLAKQYDLYIVSDEIHADLIFSGSRHYPIIGFDYDKVILVSAPSKTFNIPGLYASYLIVPEAETRLKIEAVQQAHFVHPNALASTAIIAAYTDSHSEQWLGNLLDYLEANRNHAVQRIQTEMPRLTVVSPDATFLLWIDCQALPFDDARRATWLVEEAGLALTHGRPFGTNALAFERLNFGCPRSQLDEALDRLHSAYQKLNFMD
ncbi:aminotransferase class I/II [Exiguobacterium sp. KRL4]|uniref:MalY/PatB family protein n=1 Tax=Exiguobacterium sp. KRL4 TaxID=1914536 RepID=UPI0008F8DBCE|nr:MalY/PatB family protein [Exiguobacterium sp. KRL4]OIN68031.1 aminotransferase class I/II [Exiguobacterium sp. KRL4]